MIQWIKEHHRPQLQKALQEFTSPFFYYDLDGLRGHLEQLFSLQKQGLAKLWYASKANPLSHILKEFKHQGFGVDISTVGEMEQVLKSGFAASEIIATGPAKSPEFLKLLLQKKVGCFVLESANQAEWLNSEAKAQGVKARALLRVQLPWDSGKSVLGGDAITPFGVGEMEWHQFKADQFPALDILGFHVFQWGNVLEASKLKSIWRQIAVNMQELSKDMNIPLQVLDLGGGFGIPYSIDERPLEISAVAGILKELKKDFGLTEIWLELGRFAIGEYGSYCAKVIDRKIVRGKDLLIMDGGINHMARPVLTGQSFPAELFRPSKQKKKQFFVHGPLCTALDRLGEFQLPEDIVPGDWIAFHQAGAYGFTESLPFFLCHNLAGEAIIDKGVLSIVRQSQSASFWLV